MSNDTYTGDVCYRDGWHYTVDQDDQPDRKLYLSDDGGYRYAREDDQSWHDRKHRRYASVEMEDGTPSGLTVTPDELEAVKAFLAERRG